MPPTRPLRIGFKSTQLSHTYDDILPLWLEADQLGFDTGWLFDHFAGIGHMPIETECPEGWTLLTALLARTERIRGGLMVTGNTHRHPALLAKIAATVDQVSAGRLEFGLGAGWSVPEHEMYGWDLPPVPERIRWFNEACEAIKSLWTNEKTTFEGKRYTLRDATCNPKPIQKPYPHFVIGASGEQLTTRAAVRHADEWNWVGGPLDTYKTKVEAVAHHCSDLDRDPASLERSVQWRLPEGDIKPAELAAEVKSFTDVGVDHVIFNLTMPYKVEQVRWIWSELVPAVRDAVGR